MGSTEQVRMSIGNGYHLIAERNNEPGFGDELVVYVVDAEEVFVQDIVTVKPIDESFKILVYADEAAEDYTDEYSVDLWHDPEDADEESDDEDQYDDETDDIDEETDDVVLEYGDTGDDVKRVQTRLMELGFFSGTIGGNYLQRTTSAVEAFQTAAGLHVDGICDKTTMDAMFASKAPHDDEARSTSGETHGSAVEMDWWKSNIQKIFAKGVIATITDVDTGLTWKEQRRGGTNHADVQPVTAADTAALKKAYGGKWSWNRRAIWVTINGVNYAASMNGMPHGGSSINDNNFDGHHCIHFTNSRTHCSDKVCPNHQKMIKKAAAAIL